jgi:hypothetical protein
MGAALITGAAAAPAGAATAAVSCSSLALLSDPAVVPSPQTAKTATGSTGTAQIRYGTYNGVQYGWARTTDYNYDDLYIKFELDTNGDRETDCQYYRQATSRTYTTAKATHSSSDVAFRACLVFYTSSGCDAAATKTGWW